MAVTEVTYRCGHTGEVNVTGIPEKRAAKIARIEADLCGLCEIAEFEQEHAEEIASGAETTTIDVYLRSVNPTPHSFRHESIPVTIILDRLSPVARQIAESVIATDSLYPGSEYVVENPETGGRFMWSFRYPKYHGLKSVYDIFERTAREVEASGLRVVGPGWHDRYGTVERSSLWEPERRVEQGARLTLVEAARIAGLSPSTLRVQVNRGKLDATQEQTPRGPVWYVTREALNHYIENNRRGPVPKARPQ